MKSVLKFCSGLLFGIAVVTMCLLGWFYIGRQPLQVVVHGVIEAERQQDIEALFEQTATSGGPLVSALDIVDEVHELPWTKDVKVWRTLANVLHIEVGVKRAMARLDEGTVLTTVGDIIRQSSADEMKLPTLVGYDSDERVKTDAQTLTRIRIMLEDAGFRVAEFEHTIKGWNVELGTGDSVLLGRDELEHRLARFLTVYSKITKFQPNTIVVADARYEHGVAVKQEMPNKISFYESSEGNLN